MCVNVRALLHLSLGSSGSSGVDALLYCCYEAVFIIPIFLGSDYKVGVWDGLIRRCLFYFQGTNSDRIYSKDEY